MYRFKVSLIRQNRQPHNVAAMYIKKVTQPTGSNIKTNNTKIKDLEELELNLKSLGSYCTGMYVSLKQFAWTQ